MHRMFQLPNHRRRRVWQRLGFDVLIFPASHNFLGKVFCDRFRVILAITLAISM